MAGSQGGASRRSSMSKKKASETTTSRKSLTTSRSMYEISLDILCYTLAVVDILAYLWILLYLSSFRIGIVIVVCLDFDFLRIVLRLSVISNLVGCAVEYY